MSAKKPNFDRTITKVIFLLFIVIFVTGGYRYLISSHAATPSSVAETYRSSCATAPVGYATCFALIRTDKAATSAKPLKPSARATDQAEVVPGSCATGSLLIGNCGAYDPSFIQAAYNLTSLAATGGKGQIVGIIDASDDPTAEADLASYRSEFNLPSCTTANGCFHKVNQDGIEGDYPSPDPGWQPEISIDIDMVSAVCPNCKIVLVEANSGSDSDLAASENTAYKYGASAISNSYGDVEGTASSPVQNSAEIAAYNHPGVGITAGSGDSGYGVSTLHQPNGDGLSWPAVLPSVTAVGGTSLNQAAGTATREASETAWDGAGSGCSQTQPKPSWQKDTGCSNKAIGDVSAVADVYTPVWFYSGGNWDESGGTSVASPIIASIIAMDNNQYTYSPSLPYANASSFNDITQGSNGTCTVTYLCNAGSGYDGPTGLGTPKGAGGFQSNPSTDLPTVSISSPALGTDEQSGNFTVSGTVSDSSKIKSVQISVDGGTLTSAKGTTSWTATLNASSYPIGLHLITVKATNAKGNSSIDNLGILTGNAVPPNAPVSLSANAASSSEVDLAWQPNPTVSGTTASYNIYQDGSIIATGVSGLSYKDLSVQPNFEYAYTVAAVGTNGLTSSQSNQATTTVPAIAGNPPGAPTLKIQSSTSNSVTLSWSPGSSTIGIQGYAINRSYSGVSTYVGPNTFTYTDTTMAPGIEYTFTVDAIDLNGTYSQDSNSINFEITAPPPAPLAAPTGFTASAINYGQVDLTWNASVGGVGGVAEYSVYRNGGQVVTARISSNSNGTFSLVDGTVSPNTQYSYYIIAYDYGGNSSPQSVTQTVTTLPITPVSVLTGTVSASAKKDLSGVSVTDTASNGVVYSATTNSNGVYEFSSIPAGVNKLSFQLSGYKTKAASLTLNANSITTENMKLAKK